MTEEELHNEHEEYSGKSALELIRELLKLLLVLLWRFLIWLIKKFLKGVLWCMKTAERSWDRLNDWWHDNNTQEKVAKIKAWLKRATKTCGHWCLKAGKATLKGLKIGLLATGRGLAIAAKATVKGVVIGIKATIQGIIHLRPTIKKIGRLTVAGFWATIAGIKRCRRGMRLSQLRRKRAYATFKRNGGMKGVIINSTHNVRTNIERFMEEDQEEAAPDAVTEDDIMEEATRSGVDGILVDPDRLVPETCARHRVSDLIEIMERHS